VYRRGGAEFNRVLTFSDGVFAIAMTLLVVGITVPTIKDGGDVSELADAINDLSPNIVSFFISFAVIGRYWVAHHEFFSRLKEIDGRMMGLNLLYLAFVAFLPFPTALLGSYFENPLSIAIYALNVGIVSGMEVVLYRHAHRNGLMETQMPEAVYRWGAVMSLSPVLFFMLSIPVAFLSTTLAVLSWFLAIPFGMIAARWMPAEGERFFARGAHIVRVSAQPSDD
jgi:uncharacterized membrane protein